LVVQKFHSNTRVWSWVISVLVTWQWPLRRSRSFKVTNFGTNLKLICDFLLVINSNLPPILHGFRDIALEMSKIATFSTPLWFNHPTEGFPWDNLRKIFTKWSQMAKVPNGVNLADKHRVGLEVYRHHK